MNVNIIKATILGHAIGDALGVPVEFFSREDLEEDPVIDMEGYGTYPMPEGAWSDDTSMTLCALESLGRKNLDFADIMNNFGKWYYKDEFTPTGKTFDMGNACSMAIENYFQKNMDYQHCGLAGEYNNGNGSLMRIIPFALYLKDKDCTIADKLSVIDTASALTHAHKRSKIACGIYSIILWKLIDKPCKGSIKEAFEEAKRYYGTDKELKYFERLDTIEKLPISEIKSSCYVVDTLEAAIWCVMNTDNYKDCVLKAVNLGDDTDSVAAVTGGLAGALYGLESIPTEWLSQLKRRFYIEDLCETAAEKWK